VRTYKLITLDLTEIKKKIKTDFYITIFVQTILILFPCCRAWKNDSNHIKNSKTPKMHICTYDYQATIWRFNDFQNGGRPISWILNICRFCHLALAVLLRHTKFRWNRTIGRWVMGKKVIFKMAAAPSWIFKNEFLVTWTESGSTFATVYRISSKSDDFSLRYGDLTIFEMAAVRRLGFQKFADFVI